MTLSQADRSATCRDQGPHGGGDFSGVRRAAQIRSLASLAGVQAGPPPRRRFQHAGHGCCGCI